MRRATVTTVLAIVFSIVTAVAYLQAQTQTPEEVALERIEAAAASEATELNLSDLGLTELPPEIGQLTNLQELDLWGNQLTVLPPEIGQLTNLRWLDVAGNQLTVLPPEIGQLTNLRWLDVAGNPLPSDYPTETEALLEYLREQQD
jgi:Leucine-rich repeat (LRR) protein